MFRAVNSLRIRHAVDVAYALVRAVSRLVSTLFCVKENQRRNKCGTHESGRRVEKTISFQFTRPCMTNCNPAYFANGRKSVSLVCRGNL
jgi:hypothetical protein